MEFTDEERSAIRSAFLFHDLPEEKLQQLPDTFHARLAQYDRGEIIFSMDRFSRELGVLLSGQIRVTKGDLVVSVLRPGELFGAAALFNQEERYVSDLTAISPCRILFFDQQQVRNMIEQDPQIRWIYIRYLSERIHFLSDKVSSLILSSGKKKLAEYLLHQMDEDGKVTLDCSLTELAARLHVGRASLYRDLDHMEQQGLVVRKRRTLWILQPKSLLDDDI